ncbi:MAG: hypothetical protein SOW08_14985 [Lachnospiraceae bacterium]|nr:hypothetical protein [Lachnospiraceae bacterium]
MIGQKFTLEPEGKKPYVTDIALDDGSGAGSCRRISYIKKDGYCYSLYQVSYDRILKRFQSRYPGTDFSRLMYNQKIHFQVDFYLCLVRDGKDQGTVMELDNGCASFDGTVYCSLDQILKAADWSRETRESLKGYYGIQMTVFQPSTWYITYHRNDRSASGSMDRQSFTYGTTEKLIPCRFTKVITVTLDPGGVFWRGEQLEKIHTMLISRFLGWSLKPDGKKKYSDQAEVGNLTDRHKEEIPLYAIWSAENIRLPQMNCDTYEFVGWSLQKMEVLPADTGEDKIKKLELYGEGSSYIPDHDMVFYAVWKWKKYKVRFQVPESYENEDQSAANYYYGREEIRKIRKLITDFGFAGYQLNQAIIRGGFA